MTSPAEQPQERPSVADIIGNALDHATKAQVIEAILASGRQDNDATKALLETLFDAQLLVPVTVNEQGERVVGGVRTKVDDKSFMVVFTSTDATRSLGDLNSDFTTMNGRQIIGMGRPDLGLVVQAPTGSFGMPPEMLVGIRGELERREVNPELQPLADKVARGEAPMRDLETMLMSGKVVAPTPDRPGEGRGYVPLIHDPEGAPRIVVCASFPAAAAHREQAAYALSVPARFVFGVAKEGVGIVLRTVEGEIDFPPQHVADLTKRFPQPAS